MRSETGLRTHPQHNIRPARPSPRPRPIFFWSETGQDRSQTKNRSWSWSWSDVVLWNTAYVTLIVIMILKDTATSQVLFIVSLFCAWNITTVEVNSGVHLLKSSIRHWFTSDSLGLVILVLVLRIWSCLYDGVAESLYSCCDNVCICVFDTQNINGCSLTLVRRH